jgi:hypothetical protein
MAGNGLMTAFADSPKNWWASSPTAVQRIYFFAGHS